MKTREGFIVRPMSTIAECFGGQLTFHPVRCKVLCEHRGKYWVQTGVLETKEINKEDLFNTEDEAWREVRLKQMEMKICSLERRLSEKDKKHSFWG